MYISRLGWGGACYLRHCTSGEMLHAGALKWRSSFSSVPGRTRYLDKISGEDQCILPLATLAWIATVPGVITFKVLLMLRYTVSDRALS